MQEFFLIISLFHSVHFLFVFDINTDNIKVRRSGNPIWLHSICLHIRNYCKRMKKTTSAVHYARAFGYEAVLTTNTTTIIILKCTGWVMFFSFNLFYSFFFFFMLCFVFFSFILLCPIVLLMHCIAFIVYCMCTPEYMFVCMNLHTHIDGKYLFAYNALFFISTMGVCVCVRRLRIDPNRREDCLDFLLRNSNTNYQYFF